MLSRKWELSGVDSCRMGGRVEVAPGENRSRNVGSAREDDDIVMTCLSARLEGFGRFRIVSEQRDNQFQSYNSS